jgi:Domain of unknown function (DUF4129)
MIAVVPGVPRPEARELRACALAAIAEAGVIALPTHLFVTESGGAAWALFPFVLGFVSAFVAGAVLACRFRASSAVPTAAAVVAVLAGIVAGEADLTRSVFVTAVSLVIAFRVVTLGVRDWRSPLHAEIGWFAVALGLEAAIASGPEPGWRPLLVAIIPIFFVCALASRATTVWTGGAVTDLDDRVRGAWIRRAIVATIGLVAVMAVAVGLSIRGGLFDRVGRALTPVADALVSFLGWALGQASRPFFWLVDRFGIDPGAVREFFERLREGGLGDRAREQVARPDAALWQRLLGLAVFLLVGYAIVRAIRRLRPRLGADERPTGGARVRERALGDADEPPPVAPRVRHELPADAVRRWYAESLIALEGRGVPKPAAATPTEFVGLASAAYPAGADDHAALTRAYEDVRYGSLRLGDVELGALERRVGTFLRLVREDAPQTPPIEDDDTDPRDGVGARS